MIKYVLVYRLKDGRVALGANLHTSEDEARLSWLRNINCPSNPAKELLGVAMVHEEQIAEWGNAMFND